MATRKQTLSVTISGDAKGLERAFKQASGASRGFEGAVGRTARIATAAFATMGAAAVGGFAVAAKASVKAASDINESLTKNEALFGRHAKAIEDYSKRTATSLGISRAEALEAAGTFGGLFSALEMGQKPAAEMSERLVTLAADLASFNNASPEEALTALRSGLSGEAEPMRRFNAFLSEARVKAEAYKSGIAAVGAELTEQQKVQARYNLILKDTADAHGDFERTSDGLANQQRILKASVRDVSGSFGEALLPTVQKTTQWINRNLVPALKDTADAIGDIFDRDDLDLGQKLGMSAASVKQGIQPVIKVIGDELESADLGPKLRRAIDLAIPAMMNAAAAAAPKVAETFIKGWLAAGSWGQLFAAGWLIKKTVGFAAAGKAAAALFGLHFSRGLDDKKTGVAPVATTSGTKFGKAFGAAAALAMVPLIRDALTDLFGAVGVDVGQYSGKQGWAELWKDIKARLGFGGQYDPGNEWSGGGGGSGTPPVDIFGRVDSFPGGRMPAGSRSYPLGSRGQVIGVPGQGTHSPTEGPNNWQSDNAIDIRVPNGTTVLAIEDGTISKVKIVPNSGGRFAGSQVTLVGKTTTFFYTHLSRVAVRQGQSVRAGQVIGASGIANGVPHLHLGVQSGDPRTILRNAVVPTTSRGGTTGMFDHPNLTGTSRSPGGGGGGQRAMPGLDIPAAFVEAINRYGPMVSGIARQYGISGEALLAKLLKGESGFRMDRVSSAGARGAAQFMPASRRAAMEKFGVDPWASPDQAVHAAVLHLTGQLGHRKGLAGYNPGGGQGYVDYILKQKVGAIEDVDVGMGGGDRLGAQDFARLALPIIRQVLNPFRKVIGQRFARIGRLQARGDVLGGEIDIAERLNALTSENLATAEGRTARVGEITGVLKLGERKQKVHEAELRAHKLQIADYTKIVRRLNRRLRSPKVSRHLRPRIREERDRILDRIDDLEAAVLDLGGTIEAGAIGLEELRAERSSAALGEFTVFDDTEGEEEFSRASRGFDLSREDLSTQEGREARVGEINYLKQIRQQQIAANNREIAKLRTHKERLEGRIAKQRRKLNSKRLSAAGKARVRATIAEMQERVVDIATAISELTGRVEDLNFDIGGLTNEIADIDRAAAESVPSALERLGADLSLISDQQRAGIYTEEGAAAARVAQINAALAGHYGPVSERERISLLADLADAKRAQEAQLAATKDNTSELEAVRKELERKNNFDASVIGRSMAEVTRALADVMSGQLGPQMAARGLMPGDGSLARY